MRCWIALFLIPFLMICPSTGKPQERPVIHEKIIRDQFGVSTSELLMTSYSEEGKKIQKKIETCFKNYHHYSGNRTEKQNTLLFPCAKAIVQLWKDDHIEVYIQTLVRLTLKYQLEFVPQIPVPQFKPSSQDLSYDWSHVTEQELRILGFHESEIEEFTRQSGLEETADQLFSKEGNLQTSSIEVTLQEEVKVIDIRKAILILFSQIEQELHRQDAFEVREVSQADLAVAEGIQAATWTFTALTLYYGFRRARAVPVQRSLLTPQAAHATIRARLHAFWGKIPKLEDVAKRVDLRTRFNTLFRTPFASGFWNSLRNTGNNASQSTRALFFLPTSKEPWKIVKSIRAPLWSGLIWGGYRSLQSEVNQPRPMEMLDYVHQFMQSHEQVIDGKPTRVPGLIEVQVKSYRKLRQEITREQALAHPEVYLTFFDQLVEELKETLHQDVPMMDQIVSHSLQNFQRDYNRLKKELQPIYVWAMEMKTLLQAEVYPAEEGSGSLFSKPSDPPSPLDFEEIPIVNPEEDTLKEEIEDLFGEFKK